MVSTSKRYAKDRGIKPAPAVTVLTSGAVDDDAVNMLASSAGVIRVIDRIYWRIPTDVTAWDITIAIDGINEAGTARDLLTVDDSGVDGVIDPRMAWDIDFSNPPTGFYYGYMEMLNCALGVTGDTLTITGNSATDAENYTSTGATAAQLAVHYREIDSSVW